VTPYRSESRVLSLWICLFVLQGLNLLLFVLVLRSDWLVEWRLYPGVASCVALGFSLFWFTRKFGFATLTMADGGYEPRFIPWTRTRNPWTWLPHFYLSPMLYVIVTVIALIFVDFVPPNFYFPDGIFLGPQSIQDLKLPLHGGSFQVVDGSIRHDLGGAVNCIYSQSGPPITYFADPFVEDNWTIDQPVRVWVIHKKDREPTAKDQYANVISRNHSLRTSFPLAIENSHSRFQTISDPDAVCVQLSSSPPVPGRLSYLTVVTLIYLFTALYTITFVTSLVLPSQLDERDELVQ
jgi:hypothetical protein